MKKSRLLGAVCSIMLAVVAVSSHAALVGMLPATPGGTDWQAVYDDDRDISWVADANLVETNNLRPIQPVDCLPSQHLGEYSKA